MHLFEHGASVNAMSSNLLGSRLYTDVSPKNFSPKFIIIIIIVIINDSTIVQKII